MSGATVHFHRLAARELRQACEWYEMRGVGLGQALAAEVDWASEQIAAAPDRWPTFRRNYRWFRLHRFPYVLYYNVVEPSRVLVLAVAHGRRRPGYWLHRATRP
jgi:plasmid stabilization system protein ParE